MDTPADSSLIIPPSEPSPPTVPPPPTIQPEPKQKGHLNLLTVLLFLILIALCITGYFAYQNMQIYLALVTVKPTPTPIPLSTPTPTSLPLPTTLPSPTITINPKTGWHVYTNTQMGLSFEYPSDYDSDTGSTSDVNIVYLNNKQIPKPVQTKDTIQFPIEIRKMSQAYFTTSGGEQSVIGMFTRESFQQSPISVGDITGKKYSGNWSSYFALTGYHAEFFVTKGDAIFEISFYPSMGIPEQMFTQILSTFQFTNASGTTTQSCVYKGKTYAGGEGFKDQCNSCSCEKGQVSCTAMFCQ